MLWDVGVLEVYFRISLFLVVFFCYYGIDIFDRKELIVVNYLIEEIVRILGVDLLEYLSLNGLNEVFEGRIY